MPIYRICLLCKQPMTPWENRLCPSCRELSGRGSNPNYMRDYWRKRRSDPAFKAKEAERMKALNAKKPIEERRKYVRDNMRRWYNQPENRTKLLAKDRAAREEMLNAYGHRCECCGESHSEFLAVDHPNNDGAAHRRSIHGVPIHRWLKKHGYPSGFRLLCHNCNFARGKYGACPHLAAP